MSTLAGWAGAPQSNIPGPAELQQMLAASWRDATAPIQLHAANGCAAAVIRGPKPASLYHDADLLIAITGNLYWEDAALQQLASAQGDAHAAAQAFRRSGEQFLPGLNGSFALAIIDASQGRTLLAIDPMGIEKLCYTRVQGQLVFGNSLQGLKAHRGVSASISKQAIFDYFYYHTIPAPRTIYEGMFKLEPGELLIFANGSISRSKYAPMHFQDTGNSPVEELVTEFHRALKDSVGRPLQLFDDVGAFLSGGTDSSCVTAAVTAASGKARTFSIGFDAEGYDESEYARITVDRFKTEHHHYYVTPQDVVDALPTVAAYYDEPFGNASAVPAYFCARLAREAGIRNLLAGDGGDEIFGGNTRYVKQKVFEYWRLLPAPLRTALIEPLVMHFPLGERIAPLRKLRSYIAQANIPLPDRLETYNFLHREPLTDIFSPDFLRGLDADAPLAAQRKVYGEADCASSLNRMLFLDMKFTLADNDLRKVNGMCELAGVNVHYPLIDLEMVRFAARVPVDMKIKGHKLRWFFKHALKDTLAPETLTKSKHGFGLPFGVWMNDFPALHQMAVDNLERLKARGYLRPEYIDSLWARHGAEHSSYYGTMIWICMMLEQWLEAHE
jgi:asparagine synthase (glutamine-hydrolysing)